MKSKFVSTGAATAAKYVLLHLVGRSKPVSKQELGTKGFTLSNIKTLVNCGVLTEVSQDNYRVIL